MLAQCYNNKMNEVYVRHGEASAEANWHLTQTGKNQAEAAAKYLRSHFPRGFNRGLHSGSRRAAETAELLGIANIEWAKDERLREANWNGMPVPREFASWKEMYNRVGAACGDWHVQNSDSSRIIVSHGGTMQMVRAYRESLIDSRFHLLFAEPYKYFTNCQIIIYSDENPNDGVIDNSKLWVKSVCPWDLSRFDHDWMLVD
jgi:broad specificity phosphatase PhoE